MAATFVKFNDFANQLALGKHIMSTDAWYVALTNSAPSATQATAAILSNITQISGTNGYATGGASATASFAFVIGTGVVTMTGTKVVWTCATGPMGPFEWVVLFNNTQGSPVKPLIGYWDYASAVTLQIGE